MELYGKVQSVLKMEIKMLKAEKKPEIEILERKAWNTANIWHLSEKQRKDLPFVLVDFCEERPSISIVTKDVFKGRRKTRFSQNSKKALHGFLATLRVLNTPKLMEAIKKSEEDLKAGRYRKYEDFAKEKGFL